jgi:hypothetical protein
MYLQVMEKQILETILNFLEAHQIDTTEFRQRAMMIFNNNTTNFNGAINNSGSIFGSVNNSGNMAVGGGQIHNQPASSARP